MAFSSNFLFEYNIGPGETVIDHLGNGHDLLLDTVITYNLDFAVLLATFLISFHRHNSPFTIRDVEEKSFVPLTQDLKDMKRPSFALTSGE